MPKRVLEGGTQQDRAKIRRQLGTLRQLTVQPVTRKRYDKAVGLFAQGRHRIAHQQDEARPLGM